MPLLLYNFPPSPVVDKDDPKGMTRGQELPSSYLFSRQRDGKGSEDAEAINEWTTSLGGDHFDAA